MEDFNSRKVVPEFLVKIMNVVLTRRIWENDIAKTGGFDRLLAISVAIEVDFLFLELPLDFKSNANYRLIFKLRNKERIYFLKLFWIPYQLRIILVDNLFYSLVLLIAFIVNKGRINLFSVDLGVIPIITILKKLRFQTKIWFHIPDYTQVNRFQNKLLNKLHLNSLKQASHFSDIITVPNLKIFQVLENDLNADPSKIYIMRNLPVRQEHTIIKPTKDFGQFKVVIATSEVNRKFLILETLKAFRKVDKEFRFYFLIMGAISDQKYFEELNKYALDQKNFEIEFTGLVSGSLAATKMNGMDIGVAIYSDKTSYAAYGESLKIWQYTQLGLAVIGSDFVSPMNLIHEFGSGWKVSNPDEITKIIESIDRIELISRKNNSLKFFIHQQYLEENPISRFKSRFNEIFI